MRQISRLDLIEKSDRKAPSAAHQLDAIFAAFPDLLFFIDSDGRILDYRAGEKSALYLAADQYLGKRIQDVLPAEVGQAFDQAIVETLSTAKIVSIDYRLEVPAGLRSFEARLVPADGSKVFAIVRDVTERARAAEQVQRHLQRLSALHAVDSAITASFDLNVTLSVILRQVVNQLGIDAADVLLFNPRTRMLEFASGHGFNVRELQYSPIMIGQGYAGTAALERRTVSIFLDDQQTNPLLSPRLMQQKFSCYYAVPLIAKGQVKGVLEIYHRSLLEPDDNWLDFLATIAGQAAVAIDSASLFQNLQQTNVELSLAYDAAIESWARVLELSNRESGEHAYRVVDLTIQLARSMEVADEEIVHLRRGALLHDVGKLGIPEGILNKPGPLDNAEQEIVRTHPRLAHQLLASLDYLAPALDIPLHHHERWDGSGYPDGLRGEQISFASRLFAVVDVYDALTSTRPYRAAWSSRDALQYITEHSGKLFDARIVRAFLQLTETGL
jgi:HD-GYP domain-containing protein (c-di-GMP phosphodiesterase class II)